MLESEFHPLGAIAFAEARGQKIPELVEAVPVDNNVEVKQKDKDDMPK